MQFLFYSCRNFYAQLSYLCYQIFNTKRLWIFIYIDVMGLVANVIVCAIWSLYFFILKKEPTDEGEGVTAAEPILDEKV